jgi:SAM-dependent methyltransferase
MSLTLERREEGARRPGTPAGFDTAQVRDYYDRHTATFVSLGRGGSVGAIHRAVWAPGVATREQAFHYVNDQVSALIRALPAGGRAPHVVDLGCGVGASLCHIAGPLHVTGTGVTLSPVQADLARRRVAEANLTDRVVIVEASFDALPGSVGQADVAYAIESFAHAPDPSAFFAQCGRLVRPGGVLAICDDVRRLVTTPRAARAIARFERGWHLNSVLPASGIHALARAAGFAHESTTDLTPWLEPRSVQDHLLDACLGWLPLGRTSLGPVLGGTALKTCQAHGWLGYEFMVFRRG